MTIESTPSVVAAGFPAPAVGPGGPPGPAEAPPAEMPYVVQVPRSQAGPDAAAVKELQRRLKAAGFDPGPVDGWFGPRTAGAVRAFQQAKGLKVDAEVGPKTWGALGLRGAPRAAAPAQAAPPGGPNQASQIGLPPAAAAPAPGGPAPFPPGEGTPHERRHEWFLSQQRGPFNPNEDVLGNGNCGPSSVTMIARAFGMVSFDAAGVDAAVEESRRRIGDGMNEKKGTSIAGLERALESYGLDAQVKSSPRIIELIQGELAKGRLVIGHVRATYLRPNATTGHYTVVTAIEDGFVYLNDSSNLNGPIRVTIKDFEKGVAARGTYTIVSAAPRT